MTTHEVLQKTKDFLKIHGWIQGTFRNSQGHCLTDALWRVTSHDINNGYDEARKILVKIINNDNLVNWNDAIGRSKESNGASKRK